jgi:hypothetical protein
MTDDEINKVINARLEALFDLYPIDDLRPVEVRDEMRDGMIKAYAHKGFRTYLENAVKVALKKMAIASTPVEIAYYKSRVDVLEQLLANGKMLFQTLQPKKGK